MRYPNRKPCIGGCGREVLVVLGGECRKCRRKRIHAGARRIALLARAKKSQKKYDRVLKP